MMLLRLLPAHYLVPGPVGNALPAGAERLGVDIILQPSGQSVFINQGDDPPDSDFGDNGRFSSRPSQITIHDSANARRKLLPTIPNMEAASQYEGLQADQLQERILNRVLAIATYIGLGGVYKEQIVKLNRDFDYIPENLALRNLVEDKEKDKIKEVVGKRRWLIRAMAVTAYVELHILLPDVTFNEQCDALAILRNWLHIEEVAVARWVPEAYRKLLAFTAKQIGENPELVHELIAKEINALQGSIEESTHETMGKEFERQLLEHLQDLIPTAT